MGDAKIGGKNKLTEMQITKGETCQVRFTHLVTDTDHK